MLMAFMFACSAHAAPAVYYVSVSGNDSSPGTVNEPWKTISKAASTVAAGDTVYIKSGTYNEQVIPAHSGSVSGGYIIYSSCPGELAIIDDTGLTMPGTSGLFLIDGKSYVKVMGLRVQNVGTEYDYSYSQAGIYVRDSDHVEINDCYTFNTFSSGIRVSNSHDVVVDGNTVELACNDGEQECISVDKGSYVFEIKNNTVFNGGPGSHGAEGIDVKDGAHDGKIYKNKVR